MDDGVDVVIVGGGVAGLSAALVLGRSRREVIVVDSGVPRNRPAKASHNYLTRDGTPPAELLRLAREEMGPYKSVRLLPATASEARALPDGAFEVLLTDGRRIRGRKIILATGVRDLLPPLPGVAERWGRSVFHCPYCHGYEARDEPVAVLAAGDAAVREARLMRGWTRDVIVFTDGGGLEEGQRGALARMGVDVRRERIEGLVGEGASLEAISLAGGERVARRAALLRPPTVQSSPLAAQLGCALTGSGHVRVGPSQETNVRGVYAAGDCARASQQLVFAAADGAAAAIHLNHALLEEIYSV